MAANPVYIGIDVACGKGKALPLCIVSAGEQLNPLMLPLDPDLAIPRGLGNKEILSSAPFEKAARDVTTAIARIAAKKEWSIERIAIDAPAAPPTVGARTSEANLRRRGLSSFATPSVSDWPKIRKKCVDHLNAGRKESSLPHANQIWMLFGFELFKCLRREFKAEVIEVYPYSIVRELLPTCQYKSTESGYHEQLRVIAARTGWEPVSLKAALQKSVRGSRHDKLDAFMSAWIASLPPAKRRAIGNAEQPDDAIWVPATGLGQEQH